MLIELLNIHKHFGQVKAVNGASLTIEPGKIHGILGENGAGKSTTMKSIMGLTPPKIGAIQFEGVPCTGWQPYRMARMGIGFVPDDRRVFADLTVGENLEISERPAPSGGWDKGRVYDFFPALGEIDGRRAGFLSGGEQQMLTIARALMTNPVFILLDEPTEGLAPMIVRMLEEQILRLKESGMTVLLAEQNLDVALRLSDRGYVIDNGMIRYHGTGDDLRDNEEVRDKYLCV